MLMTNNYLHNHHGTTGGTKVFISQLFQDGKLFLTPKTNSKQTFWPFCLFDFVLILSHQGGIPVSKVILP